MGILATVTAVVVLLTAFDQSNERRCIDKGIAVLVTDDLVEGPIDHTRRQDRSRKDHTGYALYSSHIAGVLLIIET